MIDQAYIHRIYAIRYIDGTAINSLGEPIYSNSRYVASGSSTSSAMNYIPARVEESEDKVQYRESNLRSVNNTRIYVPPQYNGFQIHDEVHMADGRLLGLLVSINYAVKGFTADLDHWELLIENP